MTFNWSDILGEATPGGGPVDLIPIGKHLTRVKETKVTPTDTGKTMIEMVLVVDGGPYDDEYLWNNLVFPNHESKPGHRRMFLRALRALGFSEAFLRDNNPTPEDLARLMVGRSVVANVSHRNWEGDDRTEVKSLHPPGGEDEVPPAPAFAGTDSDVPPPPPIPLHTDDASADVPLPVPAEEPAEEAPPPIPKLDEDTDDDGNEEPAPF
jgi:hypothetical protein